MRRENFQSLGLLRVMELNSPRFSGTMEQFNYLNIFDATLARAMDISLVFRKSFVPTATIFSLTDSPSSLNQDICR